MSTTNILDLNNRIDELEKNSGGLTASDVAYDNTDSGLTATNVQEAIDDVSGGLSDVEDRVDAKTLGTAIPLTYEEIFTAPSDGYIVGVASSGAGNYVTLNIGGVNMTRSYSGGTALGGYACAFVKKGMAVFFSGSGASNATANFYNLS